VKQQNGASLTFSFFLNYPHAHVSCLILLLNYFKKFILKQFSNQSQKNLDQLVALGLQKNWFVSLFHFY
jgi:hypothetical protein